MKTRLARLALLLGLLSHGRPTAVAAQAVVLPLLVSGQSNLAGALPALAAAYPAAVYSVWQIATPIAGWNPLDANMLWQSLYLLSHRQGHAPFAAFVWWQGESDAVPVLNTHYLADLQALILRVRGDTGQPTLPVVIVRILNYPEFAAIRAAQDTAVASDPAAVLVSTDPYQQPGVVDYHLTAAGYAHVALSIRQAVLGQ